MISQHDSIIYDRLYYDLIALFKGFKNMYGLPMLTLGIYLINQKNVIF